MSRDDGFAIADVDTSLLEDGKVRALWRKIGPDAAAMNAAMTLHTATILMSWREGKRVTAEDAAPAWSTPAELAQAIANLTDAGLLERDGRIPQKSFRAWFGAAKRRRDATRREWRERQQRRRSLTKNTPGVTRDTPPESPLPSVRPSDNKSKAPLTPPDRSKWNPRAKGTNPRAKGTNPRAVARNEPRLTQRELESWAGFTAPEWQPFKEAWLARGLHFAPFGSAEDDDTSQRGLLWQIADARPADLARWVSSAPGGGGPREIITHVLEQWHAARDEAGVTDEEWQETKLEERRATPRAMTQLGATLAALDKKHGA